MSAAAELRRPRPSLSGTGALDIKVALNDGVGFCGNAIADANLLVNYKL